MVTVFCIFIKNKWHPKLIFWGAFLGWWILRKPAEFVGLLGMKSVEKNQGF